jgi:hypothetical protein
MNQFTRVSRNRIPPIVLAISLLALLQAHSFSKTILVPVGQIFESVSSIKEIQIIEYTGDSIMSYVDLKNKDTLQLDCSWKKYADLSMNRTKDIDSTYDSWEGTFPEVGETIILLNYQLYGRNRILFARLQNSDLRFWNPNSIPFAGIVYSMANQGPYKPTKTCNEDIQSSETEFHCSDGFLMDEITFEQLKDNW